jgi:hypothetical protein
MGISVAEWAKREGITRQMAYKRIKAGKVTTLPDGTIDPDAASEQWLQNRDERQVRGKSADAPATAGATPKPEGTTFSDLQRAEKALKIQRDRLKFRREEGQIVDADDVRRAWADMITRARSVLLAIGGELADRLASESDPIRCRELIERRVNQALSALSGQPNV